jgi:hypothetical protein
MAERSRRFVGRSQAKGHSLGVRAASAPGGAESEEHRLAAESHRLLHIGAPGGRRHRAIAGSRCVPLVRRLEELGLPEIAKEIDALNKEYPLLTQAQSMIERPTRPRENYIHIRGDFRGKGVTVSPGVPACCRSCRLARTRTD